MQPDKNNKKPVAVADVWATLKTFTQARIGLGSTGVSVPLKESLQFKMAHAHARDAVFSLLDVPALTYQLQSFNVPVYLLKSNAANKHIYLKRPDLGRTLQDNCVNQLSVLEDATYDVCITLTDGLSATAINHHAMPLLQMLMPLLSSLQVSIAPICLVENGRVALADTTASLLHAKLSLMLIGERPGLSSPDSMGAYITYNPKPGLTDESRNCVSNIRAGGMAYTNAADIIFYLIKEALRLHVSGVLLKENSSGRLENL